VKIDRGGSLSRQILASPSKEKGNSNNLTVVLGTSGCQNVGSCLLVNWLDCTRLMRVCFSSKLLALIGGTTIASSFPSIGACNICAIVRLSAILALD
nr:hypothetical protein [Tanacetum cinerariifolium]